MLKALLLIFLGFILGITFTTVFLAVAVLSARISREERMPTKDEWRMGL